MLWFLARGMEIVISTSLGVFLYKPQASSKNRNTENLYI